VPPFYTATSDKIGSAYAQAQARAAFLARDNRDLARRLEGITDTYPGLNAATAMALAEAGYGKDSQEARAAAGLQAKRDRDDDGFWGSVRGGFSDFVEGAKKSTRVTLAALDVPRQYIQGGFRLWAEDVRTGKGWESPEGLGEWLGTQPFVDMFQGDNKQLNQTTLGAAIQVNRQTNGQVSVAEALTALPQGDNDVATLVNQAKGSWLPGGNSLAARQQAANARAAGMINGRATTYGRAAGALVGIQPGGVANKIMTAIIGFGNSMPDDPRDDMTAEQRAAWEKQTEAATGVAPVAYEDTEAVSRRVQQVFEGAIDAASTFTPLDPVGFVSGGLTRLGTAGRGFGGRTVNVDLLNDPVTVVAKVKNKGTGVVEDVPITVDGGTRRTVVFENALDYLTKTRKGDKFVNYAAAETSYERLATVLGRDVPPQTVLRILDESDPVRMRRLLIDETGRGFINQQPNLYAADLSAAGLPTPRLASIASATLRRPKSRALNLAPSETVVYQSDPAWAVEQYRRNLYAMRAGALKDQLTPDFISKNIEDFARGLVDPAADSSVPYRAMMSAVRQGLVAKGVRSDHADQMTAIWGRNAESDRAYWIDRATGATKNAFIRVNGQDGPLASAASSAEMFTDGIPLVNARDIAKAASRMSRLYESPGWKALVTVGDAGTAFFKFMVLGLRPVAFPLRNISEAQARIAVEGGDSILTSPLAALAWRVGDNPDSAASRILGRANRRSGRGSVDPAGEDFRLRAELEPETTRFSRALEREGGPWADERVVFDDRYLKAYRDPNTGIAQEGWLEGQRFTIAKLAGSPEYRMAVDAETPLHAKNMFWRSDLRDKMATAEPQLATREGADAYMDRVYERIQDVTGGHPDLRKAIATGRINGVPLVARDARGNPVSNGKALTELDKYADDLPPFTVAPGQVRATVGLDALGRGAEALERAVINRVFAWVSSRPNNRFVNSPYFRELTWREAARLAPLGSPQARAELAVDARTARLDRGLAAQFDNIGGPAGKLTARDIRDLAEAKAFDRWMNTVYNSHNKGNWAKSVRMIGPFAAAVADMYRFWSKAVARNPLILHRVDLGMQGARQSGFFYTDENGDERFAYPFTRALSKLLTGVDMALTGTVKGANIITSGLLPSAGPVISYPTAWLIPDEPQYDTLRSVINPYGDPDASGGLLEGLAPQNVQKILAAMNVGTAEQRRRRDGAIADVAAYLASTGRYGNSMQEQARLRADAQRKGLMLWLVQAFAQGVLPSSPKAEGYFADPSGRAIQISRVARDWSKMLREDPDTANVELLKKYGEAVFLAVTGGTVGSQLATEEAYDLARSEPQLVDKYDQVWSYFTDPNSPFSFGEFKRQIDAGERATRSLRERQVAAQTTLAWNTYFEYKDQFGPFPGTDERAYLAMVKAKLKEEFPLWDQSFDIMAGQKRVEQAFAAARDKQFRSLPVSEAVRAYEQARAQVRDWANQSGITSSETGWAKAKGTEQGRDYLRQVAAALVEQVPEFDTFWTRVFQREMVDDVEGKP